MYYVLFWTSLSVLGFMIVRINVNPIIAFLLGAIYVLGMGYFSVELQYNFIKMLAIINMIGFILFLLGQAFELDLILLVVIFLYRMPIYTLSIPLLNFFVENVYAHAAFIFIAPILISLICILIHRRYSLINKERH